MRLDGRVVAVTGASSGIGGALARALADRGAAVVGFARRFGTRELPESLDAGEIVEVALDVGDEEQVCEQFAALPRLDALVNCAGGGLFKPVAATSAEELRGLLEAHVVGTFVCSREAARKIGQSGGHVVTISSESAVQPFVDCGAYSAAKGAQLAFSRVLAEELRGQRIRVTTVLAGAVDTPIWDARGGFNRASMMTPAAFADTVADLVLRPGVSVEEVRILPPHGHL